MSRSVLFRNSREILTLQGASKKAGRGATLEDLSPLVNGAFLTIDGEIRWIGHENDLPSSLSQDAKNVDLGGASVMPAFTECHTHTIFAGDRSHEFELRNQGATYQDIAKAGGGIQSTVKETRKATFDDLKRLAQPRVNNFISQGVTTLEIKSGYGLSLDDEIKILDVANALHGPRILPTYLGPHALPSEQSNFESYIEDILENHLPRIAERRLTHRGDIFIEDGYFTIDHGRRYIEVLKEYGFDIVVHADQLTHTGATRLAVEASAKSVDHAIEISDEDITLLANSETTAVLLPAADYYIDTNYPRAKDMIEAGARVALATDFNPGSSPTQDLSFVGLLARKEMKMTLAQTIVGYTLNAAYALGLESTLGSLEVGKSADFVTFDGHYEDFFYQIGHHPVTSAWKSGEKLNFS